MSARAFLEKWLSRRHPVDVKKALDDYRNEVIQEVVDTIRNTYMGCDGHDAFNAADLAESMKT